MKWSTWYKDLVILHTSEKEFWDMSTEEIVNTWSSVVGLAEDQINVRLEDVRSKIQ